MNLLIAWAAVIVLGLIGAAGAISLFVEFPDDWAPKSHRKDPYG